MHDANNNRLSSRLNASLPVLGVILVIAGIGAYRPNALSHVGFNLLLTYAVPIALAACAQTFIIAAGDIDLSIGTFVSLVSCVVAVFGSSNPLLCLLILALLVLSYAGVGALIHLRQLPSIVVTLGLSFIWLGIAVLVLPRPGGQAPDWLVSMLRAQMPVAPLPVWLLVALAAVGWVLLQRWSFGTVMRGVGGNDKAVARAGWSVTKAKAILYGIAGLFGVLSGVVLVGITTSGDANLTPNYTLLSIAAVILGGGEFVGGKVSAVGTVLGATTLVLINALLTFMAVSSTWQLAAQGLILIAVLAIRAGISRLGVRQHKSALNFYPGNAA